MKTLKVEKNRVFLYYEMKDLSCSEILTSKQSKLRFDLTYMDDDVNLKTWRAVIRLGEAGLPVLEIRDYDDDDKDRKEYILSANDTVSDASTIALRQVWGWIEEHEDRFPPTASIPVL